MVDAPGGKRLVPLKMTFTVPPDSRQTSRDVFSVAKQDTGMSRNGEDIHNVEGTEVCPPQYGSSSSRWCLHGKE